MRHFPIYLDLRGRRVVVSGAGETAVAKLRLLLKTEARITVYGTEPDSQIRVWAEAGRLSLQERALGEGDAVCAALLYGANDDPAEDARVAALGRKYGALVNIVDNLGDSQFITPAIVDRDPVTVAIGTEGAAPVLARRIKAETEEALPVDLGILARAGQAFRSEAEKLPMGRARRQFWSRYYDEVGPRILADEGEGALRDALQTLLTEALDTRAEAGHVWLVGAGPGDPELLTLKARRVLHEADVVIYDRLVSPQILELARREAELVEVGKTPYGPAWKQADIDALIVEKALEGAHVVRLKSGDPGVFGRMDEEMDAMDAAGVRFDIVPGITSAAAAAASLKASLTKRGRNVSVRLMTGHDTDGFAEHDWANLAEPGAVAAIYMGLRGATFLTGRLMMHGADGETPVTVVENASRTDEKIVATPLHRLPAALEEAGIKGPAIVFLGLSPREAASALDDLEEAPGGDAALEGNSVWMALAAGVV
ncbi:MAG: siroheme synthase CysG [Pseudomonadota bacterium]